MQDPDIFLNQLGIEISCAVDKTQAANIDSLHRAFVNWEAYFVSDERALAVFLSEPYKYTGLVTDPISLERFQPGPDSPRVDHSGRPFYFENKKNAQRFSKSPDRHATPMIAMRRIEE